MTDDPERKPKHLIIDEAIDDLSARIDGLQKLRNTIAGAGGPVPEEQKTVAKDVQPLVEFLDTSAARIQGQCAALEALIDDLYQLLF